MANVLMFPQPQQVNKDNPAAIAKRSIEKRFGVTFGEFLGMNGERTPQVQKQIKHAMQKETLVIATKNIQE